MAKVLVLYKNPADAKAFDDHYAATHVPLAKKIPGLVRYELSTGLRPGAPYYLVATLEFASMADLKAGMGSPEGKAAAADLPNFAQAGVDLLMFDTKTV